MPNINVFRGSDASIMLSVEQTNEGTKAKEIIDAYQLTPVGRATNVEVRVTSELKPFHELGLKLLLGEAAVSRPAGTWVQPSFNIVLDVTNPAVPGISSTITLHGVKFQNWSYKIPEDDFVLEEAEFLALWISVEDKE